MLAPLLVVNINNIITTTYHIPISGVLDKVHKLTNGKLSITQVKSIIDPIIIHWLECVMSTRLITVSDSCVISDITGSIQNDVCNILDTHIHNVRNVIHMRRVHYKSYIVNDSLYILIRSCKEIG